MDIVVLFQIQDSLPIVQYVVAGIMLLCQRMTTLLHTSCSNLEKSYKVPVTILVGKTRKEGSKLNLVRQRDPMGK